MRMLWWIWFRIWFWVWLSLLSFIKLGSEINLNLLSENNDSNALWKSWLGQGGLRNHVLWQLPYIGQPARCSMTNPRKVLTIGRDHLPAHENGYPMRGEIMDTFWRPSVEVDHHLCVVALSHSVRWCQTPASVGIRPTADKQIYTPRFTWNVNDGRKSLMGVSWTEGRIVSISWVQSKRMMCFLGLSINSFIIPDSRRESR
jgi:hypothetical protein